ncbi:MAG: hypothetical protein JXR19_02575 [Bacteroidia bacterium]
MKTLKIYLKQLLSSLSKLEWTLSEKLSILLFGSAADVEYEDIPLPSEQKQKSESASEVSKAALRRKRKQAQLSLFFVRPLKRGLLFLFEVVEAVISYRKIRESTLEGNRYLS